VSGSCDLVSGSGSCDLVSGSGSCDLVSGSGSGSGHLVSDLPIETPQQDWGENVTQVLSWFPCCLAPGVVAGAGLANKLLGIKRLDKPEAV
jgi:hypothetical protein